MCNLRSSSGGTTTWAEQAIHPEARKVSSGPPFRQYLVQKYRYWYAKDPVRWYAWRRGGNVSKLLVSVPLRRTIGRLMEPVAREWHDPAPAAR